MGYSVKIRDLTTGETRIHVEDEYDYCDFMWGCGNYSCDCNRGLFYERAKPEVKVDADCDCGEARFEVVEISENGQVVKGDPRQLY